MSSRHVLSVCIFCFICATHSPCSSHADVTGSYQRHLYAPKSPIYDDTSTAHHKPLPLASTAEMRHGHVIRKRHTDAVKVMALAKRDKSMSDDGAKPKDYLRELFEMFGDGDSMTRDGFEEMLKRLWLGPDELTPLLDGATTEMGSSNKAARNLEHCVDRPLLHATNITSNQFSTLICPNILYGLLVGLCPTQDNTLHSPDDIQPPLAHTARARGAALGVPLEAHVGGEGPPEVSRTLVWVYSIGAVCVISFCGILGLAVIPVMQKTFYEPLLQFLVALAVGTLAGDALLHLLPHAMSSGHSHSDGHGHDNPDGLEDAGHDQNTWKGLVAMLGLVLFFLVERIIMIVAKWRKSQQLKNKQPTRLKVMDADKSTSVTSAADKQCKHKYSSFPYCYDEIKMIDHTSRDQSSTSNHITNNKHPAARLTAAGSADILVQSDHSHSSRHHGHSHSRSHPNITDCHHHHHNHNHNHNNQHSNGRSLELGRGHEGGEEEQAVCDERAAAGGPVRVLVDFAEAAKTDLRLSESELDRLKDVSERDEEGGGGLNGSAEDFVAREKLLRECALEEYRSQYTGLCKNIDNSDEKTNLEDGNMFGYLNMGHAHAHPHHSDVDTSASPQAPRPPMNKTPSADSGEYTVILREHRSQHHGHSHAHGHVHAAPSDLSAVVWMVIMGDGLHNFTDGMAIGAAFSNSITGGLSTALAVFCHEVPHELGDFAMLLKAGMSMRQALFYNMMSSVLCLAGNAFGVWLGETEAATSWVFAAAAGMFLYIALVDMIPELSSGHEGDESGTLLQCVLHLGGLLLGLGIMLLIACYERELRAVFNET